MKKTEHKVRRNVLLLREFTIAQLVRATGLSPGSVQTELWKLTQEELITSELKPEQYDVLYRLSGDPEKRLALSHAVEAFYPEPPEPIPPRPTSRLYQAASQSLDQAEREEGERRDELLARVACQLEGAWQAEGASRAPELVQAHILRERGRLARLEGRHEQARELFNQAGEKFVAAGLMDQNPRNESDHYISFNETTSIIRQRLCDHLETMRDLTNQLEALLNSYDEYKHNVQLLRRGAAAAADAADAADAANGDHQLKHGRLKGSRLPCDDSGVASA